MRPHRHPSAGSLHLLLDLGRYAGLFRGRGSLSKRSAANSPAGLRAANLCDVFLPVRRVHENIRDESEILELVHLRSKRGEASAKLLDLYTS